MVYAQNSLWKKLSDEEYRVIVEKGTERPFTGTYTDHFEKGTYTCKRCGAKLFISKDKFHSGCGWPAFDDAIPGAVKLVPDRDGFRTEALCANCGAHLGHLFTGEGFTSKNRRYCINSISMNFIPIKETQNAISGSEKTAYFSGGCFWGVEYYMEKQQGVIKAVSGYMGGHLKNPSYRDVSSHLSGHLETVAVTYDPSRVDFETLARLFFEIHDPTQANGQGPDIGPQYKSAIFYTSENEKKISQKLIERLRANGYAVATKLYPAAKNPFYKAESYHQDYYRHKGKRPYCHGYVKRFK